MPPHLKRRDLLDIPRRVREVLRVGRRRLPFADGGLDPVRLDLDDLVREGVHLAREVDRRGETEQQADGEALMRGHVMWL